MVLRDVKGLSGSHQLTSLVTEFVVQHSILHPSHRDQIIERLEQAVPHAVFGDAMNARIMSDRHLGHRKSVHQGERRKESVHSLKETNPLQHRASEDLERASRVVHAVMREYVPHPVRDQRGEFLDETVLPLLSPSADQVVGRGIRKQLQDIFAVLLEIAVDLDNDFARRLPKTGLERARLAVISVEVKHPNLSMLTSQAVQLVAAAITASVVDEENLIRVGT